MRTLFLSFILLVSALLYVPQQEAQVLVKDEVIAECECKNPNATGSDAVYVFECYGREDGKDLKFTLDIPAKEYPPSWAQPGARLYYGVGRGTDGKLYAIKTEPTVCDPESRRGLYSKPGVNMCLPKFRRDYE